MKRLSLIAAAVLLSACTFMGADGQSNAWLEFRQRCIERIAAGEPISTGGINKGDISLIALGLHGAQDPTDTYWSPDNVLWVLQTNEARNSCKFYANSRGDHVYERASKWLRAAYDAGRFEPDHQNSDQGVAQFESGRAAFIAISQNRHNAFIQEAFLFIVAQ